MPRGGARPGAGKPKGHKSKNTLAAEQARARLIQNIHDHMDEVFEAWLTSALGFKIEKTDKNGTAKIYLVPPNPNAIRDMLDRAMGKPVQPVEGSIDTSVDLSARAKALLDKLNALDEDEDGQDDSEVAGGRSGD